MAITVASTVAIATAISEIITVIKKAYDIGVDAWPKIQGLIENLETLWNAYVNEVEITDDKLIGIQAETTSMSEEINRLYQEKYGEDA